MEFLTIALFAAMSLSASKIFDVVKLLLAGNTKDGFTLILAFAVGVGIAFLGAATDFADGVKVGGFVFGDLNPLSLVFLGLLAGGSGSFAYDRFSKDTPSVGDKVAD